MVGIRMSVMEQRFANLLWANVPARIRDVISLAENEFNWNRSTTNTVLRRLCDNGLFKNENRVVSAIISKDEYSLMVAEKLLNDMYRGSLPAFVAAFTGKNKLTKDEAKELIELVNNSGKEKK